MRLAAAVAAWLALAWCGAARADALADAKLERDLGAEALRRGDYAIALEHFQRAYAAYPSENLRYNVGVALGGLGRYPEAIEAFEMFLARDPDAPPVAREYAKARVKELAARCGELTLTVTPADAQVTLDGAPFDPAHRPPRVAAGEHALVVTRDGYQLHRRRVSIAAGDALALAITLEPLPRPSLALAPPLVAEKPAPRATPLYKKWWLWTTIAVAAAGTAIGLGVGLSSSPSPHVLPPLMY